jgi:hypothetical protein
MHYISNAKNSVSNLDVFEIEKFMLKDVLKLGKLKKNSFLQRHKYVIGL